MLNRIVQWVTAPRISYIESPAFIYFSVQVAKGSMSIWTAFGLSFAVALGNSILRGMAR